MDEAGAQDREKNGVHDETEEEKQGVSHKREILRLDLLLHAQGSFDLHGISQRRFDDNSLPPGKMKPLNPWAANETRGARRGGV